MSKSLKRWTLMLVGVVAIGSAGWGIAHMVGQGEASPEQMQMMKQMMMNAPANSKKAQQLVQDQKKKAMAEGKYTCCLKNPCDFCALHMGQCPCGKNAANDRPVCNECKGSWYAGNGAVPGKTPDQIKTLPRPLM
jgi:hypothetical protein